jgi:hypothetical protein
MMKIEGSGSISQRLDPRIRIRINTKISWIRNTDPDKPWARKLKYG